MDFYLNPFLEHFVREGCHLLTSLGVRIVLYRFLFVSQQETFGSSMPIQLCALIEHLCALIEHLCCPD